MVRNVISKDDYPYFNLVLCLVYIVDMDNAPN
jgi:hypothetical protein